MMMVTMMMMMMMMMSAPIFQKPGLHLKFLGTGKVTWTEFQNEGPHKFGAIVQNSVATATWPSGFVHRWR